MHFELSMEIITTRNDGGLIIGIQVDNKFKNWDYYGRSDPLAILSIEINHYIGHSDR